MRWSNYTGVIEISNENYMIYNNISGHIDLIKSEHIQNLTKEAKTYLIDRGYLTIETRKVEEEKYETMVNENFENLRRNKKHIILLTYDCNLRCKYCYEQNLRKNGEAWVKKKLTTEMIDKIYEVIDHYDNQGDDKSFEIVLFGGEPLLSDNRTIVEYAFKEGTRRDRKFAVVTNGTTLDQYIDLIITYPVTRIQVSIDGTKKIHDRRRFFINGTGTFDKIISNLQLLAPHKETKINIKITVDEENLQNIEALLDYLKNIGLTNQKHIKAHIVPVFTPQNEINSNYNRDEMMSEVFDFYQKDRTEEIWADGLNSYHPLERIFQTGVWQPKYAYCKSNQGQICYDPLGDIYCCWEAVGLKEICVGQFYPELKFNPEYEKWTNRMVVNLEKCRKCKFALMCGGGCAYSAYLTHGTIDRESCQEMRLILDKYIPYFTKKYLNDLK